MPVMLSAVEDSLQLAESMQARAFGSGPRTRFSPRRLRPADILVILCSLAAAGAFVAARVTGGLPDWQPFPVLSRPSVEPALVVAGLLLAAPLVAGMRR